MALEKAKWQHGRCAIRIVHLVILISADTLTGK
jgi:hypothetical protein